MMERLPERKPIGNPKTSIWILRFDSLTQKLILYKFDQSKHFTIYSNIQNVEKDSVDISAIENH